VNRKHQRNGAWESRPSARPAFRNVA
jgi:hypothetical protein